MSLINMSTKVSTLLIYREGFSKQTLSLWFLVNSEQREIVVKPGKFLCCMFLFAFLATEYKWWLCVPNNQPTEALRLCNSRIVYEHKTIYLQGQGPSYINLNLFVCFFEAYWAC